MVKKTLWWLLIGLVVFSTNPTYSDLNKTRWLITEYQEALGLYANPFINSLSKDEETNLLQALRKKCDLIEECYFVKIQDAITNNPHNLNQQLVTAFLAKAEEDLKNQDPELLLRKQLNLLGLKELVRHLNNPNDDIIFKEANQEKIDEDDKTNQEQKSEDKVNRQDEKHPDQVLPVAQENSEQLSESSGIYKPHTKDNPKNNNTNSIVVAVNFNIPVLGKIIYDNIDRTKDFPYQTTNQPWKIEHSLIRVEVTDKYLKIYPNNQRDLRLVMPMGYVPGKINSSSATIETADNGGYRLHLNKGLYEITIPLYKIKPYRLTDYLEKVYTKSVGIDLKELPEKVQTAIIKPFNPRNANDPRAVAKSIEQHLTSSYLYSNHALPETDPIAALKAGAFQCDMAAYIMVAILRDIYKIPSRVVGGYRTQSAIDHNGEYSYLLASENGHEWVEVFINGNWQYFDPTPQSFSDNQSNNQPSVHGLEDVAINWDNTGDIAFPDENEQFYLLKKFAKQHILRYVLNPFQSSANILEKINTYQDIFADDEELKGILIAATELHQEPHDGLTDWLYDLDKKPAIDAISLLKIGKIINNFREVMTGYCYPMFFQEMLSDIKICLEKIYRQRLDHDGPHASTTIQAQDIYVEASLDEDKMPQLFYKYTDFIVKPVKMRKPGKTWQQATLTRGPDILPASRFTNWRNVIPTDPRFDLFENIERGTAFEMTNRKKVGIETKKLPDSRRLTVIYCLPGFFLDEFRVRKNIRNHLVAAFEKRAQLDKTAKHEVYFHHYEITDIESGLLYAIEQISKKQDPKVPFELANIIIITGKDSWRRGEKINYENIKKQIDAIHPATELRAMFIEISPSASILKNIANDVTRMGIHSPGVYQLITPNDISEMTRLTKEINLEEYQQHFSWSKMAKQSTNHDIKERLNWVIDTAKLINKELMGDYRRDFPYWVSNFCQKVNLLIEEHLTKSHHSNSENLLNPGSISKFREWIIEHRIHKTPELFQAILAGFYKLEVSDRKLSYDALIQLKYLLELSTP